MIKLWMFPVLALGLIFSHAANATPIYWNLFNIEEENQQNSVYVTYDSLLDMLTDTNRTGSFIPDSVGNSAENVVGSGSDGMTYWNLFNIEGENQQNSVYITYDSLLDMLTDTNRTGSFIPDNVGNSAENVVGSGSDGMTYWNLFNIEDEDLQDSVYITYDSLLDMLTDTNRTGSFIPDNVGNSAENVVGSGSDGMTYWNLFNIEEENLQDSVYITYDSLLDMLTDTNRTGSFIPDNVGNSAENVVGSGSDGMTYWNLFNIEEENLQNSVYITYASLLDMLTDTNRTGSFIPDSVGNSAENVVGSGAFVMAATTVPVPATLALIGLGLAGLAVTARRRNTI